MRGILGTLRRANDLLRLSGFDVKGMARFLDGVPWYLRDRRRWNRLVSSERKAFPAGRAFPCVNDRRSESGSASGHYFHQDLLVARRVFESATKLHVDVGSRFDGFVAHVASFRKIEVIDIRPQTTMVKNVTFVQSDLMDDLPDSLLDYCDSLSCLHAIEHFGLGRYGDRICAEGHLIGLSNIHKILRTGGKLYLSVPIGPQRTEFNAHRVFSIAHLLDILGHRYSLDRFSFVDDRGDLHENVDLEGRIADNCGCTFGCGVFELTKT
jgi:SAM-dependent methyltransferase